MLLFLDVFLQWKWKWEMNELKSGTCGMKCLCDGCWMADGNEISMAWHMAYKAHFYVTLHLDSE
jgi:hypothetical protein